MQTHIMHKYIHSKIWTHIFFLSSTAKMHLNIKKWYTRETENIMHYLFLLYLLWIAWNFPSSIFYLFTYWMDLCALENAGNDLMFSEICVNATPSMNLSVIRWTHSRSFTKLSIQMGVDVGYSNLCLLRSRLHSLISFVIA